ncbi:MAG TPA: DUF6152 family protein [Gammaproteobacteria bacterium]|nr:DUF6152 family protein [Gammaproteobacteria bacterium]
MRALLIRTSLACMAVIRMATIGIALAIVLALPATGVAHHSFAASFDVDTDVELEGVVVAVRWRNPHVEFDIRTVDESGNEQIWTAESLAPSGLRRRDVVEPFVAVGDRVRVAGNPGRRQARNVYVSNLLTATGEELILRGAGEGGPRFSDRVLEATGAQLAAEGDGSRPELGLFRVWSTPSASPFPFPEDVNPELAHTDFPLTGAARAILERFDAIDDNPINDCALKGMPTIMEQPYPMRFIERDNDAIVMHMEEFDTMRVFHMNGDDVEPVPGILGHSIGRWEGNTLIVETTHLTWGWYDTVGIPLSVDATIVERFTLAEDGSRLDWTMRVTDPATFTEPVEVEKFWFYVPGVEVRPYECTVGD